MDELPGFDRLPTKAPIIVCDDDDMIVQIVSQKLRSAGYVVQTANTGRAGLALINSQGPSLVVLDAMMPGMSGLEMLKAIRSTAKTSTVPVLMLTARRDVGHINEAVKAGVNDYLAKPFALKDLLDRVEKLLKPQHDPKANGGEDEVYLF